MRSAIPAALLAACLFLILANTTNVASASTTIHVPGDLQTIQGAIGVASDGDIVEVAPGFYSGPINFEGKSITVVSQAGPEVTTIVGMGGSVVEFESGEGRDSVIEGFTITAGFHQHWGAGIRIISASPTILDNHIVGNGGCSGAGIGSEGGSPLIEGNLIADNELQFCSGGTFGGGIWIQGGEAPVIRNNVINGNRGMALGGGLALTDAGAAVIENNIITDNEVSDDGGGIYIAIAESSAVLVRQNLISANRANDGGGVYFAVFQNRPGPYLLNNTIVDNEAVRGAALFALGTTQRAIISNNLLVEFDDENVVYCRELMSAQLPPSVDHNDTYSNGGTRFAGICPDFTGQDGNISVDPRFELNHHLAADSPVIDQGDNSAPDLPVSDIDGDVRIIDGDFDTSAVVDMGFDEFIDPDGDGVLGSTDDCPDAPGPPENGGCPVIPPPPVGGTVTLTTSPPANHTSIPYALAALIPALAAGLWLSRRLLRS